MADYYTSFSFVLDLPGAEAIKYAIDLATIAEALRWESEEDPALPQKSDYSVTFGANCISASKINLTDWVFSEDKYSQRSSLRYIRLTQSSVQGLR